MATEIQDVTDKGDTTMLKNLDFCRPTSDHKGLEYAPVTFPPSGDAPTEEEYNAKGWYRKSIQPANPPEGKVVASISYVVSGNKVIAEYTYEDAPPVVRVFSKFALEDKLFEMGLYDAFNTFIDGQTYTKTIDGQTYSMPLRKKYETANELRSDNEVFMEYFNAAKTALNLTDEQAEEILSAAEAG